MVVLRGWAGAGGTPGRVVDWLAGMVIIARCDRCAWCELSGGAVSSPGRRACGEAGGGVPADHGADRAGERLPARAGELERQARKHSPTSPRPPSSDSPYKKKGSGRSLRERGKRRPGKQPGGPGTTVNLAGDLGEPSGCPAAACCGCGAGLAGAPVTAQRRHQVTGIEPASAPKVTEYVAQAKECAGWGETSASELPAHVRARASYGPEFTACGTTLTG